MTRQVKIYLLLVLSVFTACSTKMTSLKELQARQQLEKYNQVRAILDKVHETLVDGDAHEAN
ncbi:MAG: hypothetical protein IJS08_04415, partial [Victivallales bacterium]|nr:hypothetical protein [Victivallales bacterium]